MARIVRLKESELVNIVKRVISEQVASGDQVSSKPSTPSPIPGFVFAEDDAEWLGPNGSKTTNEINEENYKRIYNYYGTGQGSDPSALIGKLAFAFKPIKDPKTQMQYSKEFLDPRMFTINSVVFSPKTKTGYLRSDKMGGYITIMPYSSKNGKILLYNGFNQPGYDAFNPVFGSIYYKLSTDPKYIKPELGSTTTKN
jgi:hypothetical protein